ncbi:MAG: glycosyl hydrolase 53 family protein [Spirochaetes bacterium]|nr:glycosyl hydrolase 53 family protein [Spirochaetota bacterium]
MIEKCKLELIGADISTLDQIEDFGGKFYHNGTEIDLMEILKNYGFNTFRLKIWNNPGPPLSYPEGYNNENHVIKMAERIKKMNMKFLLDFHYSDFWADPQKQYKPNDWLDLRFDQLKEKVYEYTKDVITALDKKNLLPDIVQIGNEIDNGLLWDDGKIDGTVKQWDRFCQLIKSGITAVHDSVSKKNKIKVMIHRGDSCNNKSSRDFFDNLLFKNVDFDIIGFSFYPKWSTGFNDLQNNLNDMALRYKKDIIIAETAFGWTEENKDIYLIKADDAKHINIPFSVEGQKDFLRRLVNIVKKIPDGRGKGIFYWEPGFIQVDGVGWKYGEGNEWCNMLLFDFKGNALDSLEVFSEF